MTCLSTRAVSNLAHPAGTLSQRLPPGGGGSSGRAVVSFRPLRGPLVGEVGRVPSRDQLTAMVRQGTSYEEVGRRAGVAPGLAYLIVTGLPADGSDTLDPEEGDREGLLESSSQHLANPPTDAPTDKTVAADWLKARVAADLPLRKAGGQRDLEPPEIAGAGETDDLVSVLGWAHGQLRRLQHVLETLPDAGSGASPEQLRRRDAAFKHLSTLLVHHERVEEQFLWPLVRETVFEGAKLAEHALDQEVRAGELIGALAHVDVDAPEADELIAKLLAALRKHLAFEDTVFRRLESATSADAREELGRQVRQARGMPTAEQVRARERQEEADGEHQEGRHEREQQGQPERRGEQAAKDVAEAEADRGRQEEKENP